MKRIVRLTESSLVNLIKKVINENTAPKITNKVNATKLADGKIAINVEINDGEDGSTITPAPGQERAYNMCLTGSWGGAEGGGTIFDDPTKGPQGNPFRIPNGCIFNIVYNQKTWTCSQSGCKESVSNTQNRQQDYGY